MYLERTERFVKEKHSVRFKMIPKDVSSRYLESQPIILTINPYFSTPLLVLFFELKWSNFLEAMASHLSQKRKKISQRKAVCSF